MFAFLSRLTKKRKVNAPLIKGTVLFECRSANHSDCPKAFRTINNTAIYCCVCKCHNIHPELTKGGL